MPLKDVLDHAAVYRLWQAPFARQKLAPVIRSGVARTAAVLDIGCGPGTNAAEFDPSAYVGVDLNARYIADARRRFPSHRFEVRDVTEGVDDLGEFDVVLMNSLMHHLSDEESQELLASVATLVGNGVVHVLDLVLPESSGVARTLALADRGEFPRAPDSWRDLVGDSLSVSSYDLYPVGLAGLEMWRMIHIVARSHSGKA